MNIRKRRLPTIKNLKHAWENKSGSEAVEMVYATAFICVIILLVMLILVYAIQINSIAYAGKRIARYIEVSGVVDHHDLNMLLAELLSNKSDLNTRVQVQALDGYVPGTLNKIQLRDRFQVILTASYRLTVADSPFMGEIALNLPIRVTVMGQSEVYWKTSMVDSKAWAEGGDYLWTS